MLGTYVALQNVDVMTPTNLPDQVPQLGPNLAPQDRLAILRDEHEMVVQGIHGMGSSTILAHGRGSYRKPPEGVA